MGYSAGAGGHTLGDLAIGPQGDVFVTDSNEPVLYWLRPGADTLESIRSPLFRSLQGIAPSPDGRVLYVADYSHGILRVDLATKSVIARRRCAGIDVAWLRRPRVGSRSDRRRAERRRARPRGSVRARFVRRSHSRETKVLDRNWAIADEPTIGTIVDKSFVYVANSQWEKYDPAMRRVASKPLTRPRPARRSPSTIGSMRRHRSMLIAVCYAVAVATSCSLATGPARLGQLRLRAKTHSVHRQQPDGGESDARIARRAGGIGESDRRCRRPTSTGIRISR